MNMIKLGVIADDFTGASDAASFLVKAGNRTVLLTEVPSSFSFACDCIVIGLKIRSVESHEAIEQVGKAVDFFEQLGIEQYYYKYCSTFDSTPKGNIGPVMDYLLERTNSKYSILCPSLPVNGRTVDNGHLYVNGVPLDKSPLKDHPLNPMWDSYIPNLMKEQSKYNAYSIDLNNRIPSIDEEHYYLVPNYVTENDGKQIAKQFKNLKVLSGGSGLLEFLVGNNNIDVKENSTNINGQKAIIMCGSCSEMTRNQVEYFKDKGNKYISVNANDLNSGKIDAYNVFERVVNNLPNVTLIYSDGCEGNLATDSNILKKNSKIMEKFFSDLALLAKENGFDKVVVAGGETSGSVTMSLGYASFRVGKSVAPGVPWLYPLDNPNMCILLKSGNFGDEKFFEKALEVS